MTDLERLADLLSSDELRRRPFDQWRYAEALGVDRSQRVSLGEGGTPLVDAPRLAEVVGLRKLWIKDESRNPTWSFKDRAASLAASHARRLGCPGLVVASTGNAAAATAAYARRAGLLALVLFAKSPPVQPVMEASVRAYDVLVAAAPTKPERWSLMQHAVGELGFFPNSNFSNPPLGNTPLAIAGYRTLGLEIWEQLDRRAPDAIVFPVGHGDAIYGVYRAFRDLAELGLADTPRLGAGEIYGSLSRALADGLEVPPHVPVDRDTVAFSIATSQSTYQALHALRESRGWVVEVPDDAVLEARRTLVETEGLFVETTAAVSLVALRHQLEAGLVDPGDEVVLVSTASGMKALDTVSRAEEIPVITERSELERLIERAATG
ncbi:MAG: threonine synthase [Gaiellaceae bacterium]